MDEKGLIEFLKGNLEINYKAHQGSYGSADIKLIELKLQGEVISEAYIDD